MFQDYALFPHLRVRDNITFGLGADQPERLKWIEHAIEEMGLTRLVHTYPHTLSGGEQQRVALLRALAPQPRVLLLDEPFSGLDVIRRAEVRSQTVKLIRDSGAATLLVTHDPEEAMFMADRILVMNHGRVVQDGTPKDTYFHPQTEFVAELFGSVNRVPGRVKNGILETNLGNFAAAKFSDGTLAQLLIRPEAIEIVLAEGLLPVKSVEGATRTEYQSTYTLEEDFTVTRARTLGRASLISLSALLNDGSKTELEARVSGVLPPKVGSRIKVIINLSQAFVFPLSTS